MKRVRLEPPEDLAVELMLDSGAFSAWTHGEEIDVHEYVAFIKGHGGLFDSVVNLDVIPGEFGVKKEIKDIERAVAKSRENLQIMKDAGLKPIPVYHQYENFKHLERMLEDGEAYIGISPSGDNIATNVNWFRDVFKIITDSEGYPVVKTHGFGVTSVPIMLQFPWYSMDSTTWVIKSGYGCIFVPQQGKGNTPNYLEDPISVWVTGEARKNSRFEYETMGVHKGGTHLRSQWITDYFESCLRMSNSLIRYNAYARMEAMAHYFQELRKRLVYAPYNQQSPSIFHPKSDRKRMEWPEKKMIFAVGPLSNVKRSDILRQMDVKYRLVSYFDLRESNIMDIYRYAREGYVRDYRRLPVSGNWGTIVYLNRRRIDLSDRVVRNKELMVEDLE